MAARKTKATKPPMAPSPGKKAAARPKVPKAKLEALIEEAVVDAYGHDERQIGMFTMLEDHIAFPFTTEVLGVPVEVTAVVLNDAQEVVAVCRHGKHTQRIPLVDLRLPVPPPGGFEWIEAYRLFASRGG